MILVCGEALIDLFVAAPPTPASPDDARPPATPTDQPANELPARAVAGGSPFNVAIGLARLGAHAAYLGGLSTDGLGRFLLGRLQAEHVDTGYVRHSARPTPLVVVSPGPDGQPDYTFHAAGTAYQDLPAAHLPTVLPPAGALALGSFSLVQEPIGSSLLALAQREFGQRVISLDPNIRASLAGDPEAWRSRFAAFAALATIIKLSIEDLALAYGQDADPADHAARWLAGGTSLVVVTRGEHGATAYHASGTLEIPGRQVTVIDTVGAGDTFHAALLARLDATNALTATAIAKLTRNDLDALLRHAVLAASITCSRRGADLPTLDDVKAVKLSKS